MATYQPINTGPEGYQQAPPVSSGPPPGYVQPMYTAPPGYGPPQHYQPPPVYAPHPGHPGQPQPYGMAVAVPVQYAPPPPGHVYPGPTGYQPITSPLISPEHQRLRDRARRSNYIACAICVAVLIAIGLGIYFGIVRCRGGEQVSGTCQNTGERDYSGMQLYLPYPKTYTHGSSCSDGDGRPGGCCDWRTSTCLTQAGCREKHEYAWSSSNGNCSVLMGLLSCAPASPRAGEYAGAGHRIYICPNFCQQLYEVCYLASTEANAPYYATPTSYCNGLSYITVRSANGTAGCYSAAHSTHTRWHGTWILMALVAIKLFSSSLL